MKRALQLSTMGGPRVSPNPFVGAVIVADDKIIGEGYHRIFGGPHAEVNAVNSVKTSDRPLLKKSTMYVTLEPCSHFGKTPPCADLIIREGIPKVVIAAPDPFLKDYASGIERLQNAGVEVKVGVMQKEAEWINRRFFTAHTLKRPYILLKWAQSADGYIAGKNGAPIQISNSFTRILMHRERALYDAIMVGTNTVVLDNPALTCRLWPSRNPEERPLKVTFDSKKLSGSSKLEQGDLIKLDTSLPLKYCMEELYGNFGVTSLMVEGGAGTIESFAMEGLGDELRIETSGFNCKEGIKAPDISLQGWDLIGAETYGENTINIFVKNY